MFWLLLVSLIWAFSFGLIKGQLTSLDASLVALLRMALALVVFLPLLRLRGLPRRHAGFLLAIGAIQFGLMYVFYIRSFRFLEAYEVAVLTIFTPILVCLFEDIAERRVNTWALAAALLATIGAGIVRPFTPGALEGIILVQASNACFAFGQVAYRRWKRAHADLSDSRVFALLFAGAVIATVPPALPAMDTLGTINTSQWLTLLYLGVIASGVCFFLWNFGSARTTAALLAVANNAKIPLAVAVSLWVFQEEATTWRVVVGGVIVLIAGLLADWTRRITRVAES